MDLVTTPVILNSLVFSVIGIVVLIGTFLLVELLTPRYSVWKEIIEKQNQALAILLGAFTIALAIIIAAAIHG